MKTAFIGKALNRLAAIEPQRTTNGIVRDKGSIAKRGPKNVSPP